MSGSVLGASNLVVIDAVTQFVGGTQATWNNITVPIPSGLVVYATDTTVFKIGDGITLYASLPVAFRLSDLLALLESLNSVSGVPTLTSTPATSDNSNAVADTAFTKNAIAAALAGDPVLTGATVASLPPSTDNGLAVAPTEWVKNVVAAALNNTPLTGTPVAPTAAPGTSTTQIATTQFVETAISGASEPGRQLNLRSFSTPGTFTYIPTSGTQRVIALAQGAGGGGGGTAATSTGYLAIATPGSAGATACGGVNSGFSGITITVGAAGTGGAAGNNNGSNGGFSSFGSFITAPGGWGGNGGAANNTLSVQPFCSEGATPYGSSSNVFNQSGQPGGIGMAEIGQGFLWSGQGGSSPYGAGGAAQSGGGPGPNAAATGYGAGGGAAHAVSGCPAYAGGNGSGGLVLVWEYS